MKKPELLDFSQERIRILHYTWIAFFISFYVWFNMAPLATTMLRNLNWLTPEHLKILAICNVALTIPARIVVGALIDRFGPRVVFSALLIVIDPFVHKHGPFAIEHVWGFYAIYGFVACVGLVLIAKWLCGKLFSK